MERLKNEADLTASQPGERVFAHLIDDLSVNLNLAGGWRVESGDETKER